MVFEIGCNTRRTGSTAAGSSSAHLRIERRRLYAKQALQVGLSYLLGHALLKLCIAQFRGFLGLK